MLVSAFVSSPQSEQRKTPPLRKRKYLQDDSVQKVHMTTAPACWTYYCTWPCGRKRLISIAQATALIADSFRLSAATHSQKRFAGVDSSSAERTRTRSCSCPAAARFEGASSSLLAISICSFAASSW